MRFDKVSAVYALFGQFFIGIRLPIEKLGSRLGAVWASTHIRKVCKMHPTQEVAARINQAEYLYLRSIQEPSDNQLEVFIEEAVANEEKRGQPFAGSGRPELAEIARDAAPIESTPSCPTFRLYWKHYAAYLVTEEMVGSCGNYDDELYEGRLFRLYTKSHFLDHLSRDTGAHSNPLLHYKVTCLNHLVDVAAENPPDIEIVST